MPDFPYDTRVRAIKCAIDDGNLQDCTDDARIIGLSGLGLRVALSNAVVDRVFAANGKNSVAHCIREFLKVCKHTFESRSPFKGTRVTFSSLTFDLSDQVVAETFSVGRFGDVILVVGKWQESQTSWL